MLASNYNSKCALVAYSLAATMHRIQAIIAAFVERLPPNNALSKALQIVPVASSFGT